MPENAERAVAQVDPYAGAVAQFLAMQVERQAGDVQMIREIRAVRTDILDDLIHTLPPDLGRSGMLDMIVHTGRARKAGVSPKS
jgi:hypothetical protein